MADERTMRMPVDRELMALRLILGVVGRLSPASRRWLLARLNAVECRD